MLSHKPRNRKVKIEWKHINVEYVPFVDLGAGDCGMGGTFTWDISYLKNTQKSAAWWIQNLLILKLNFNHFMIIWLNKNWHKKKSVKADTGRGHICLLPFKSLEWKLIAAEWVSCQLDLEKLWIKSSFRNYCGHY